MNKGKSLNNVNKSSRIQSLNSLNSMTSTTSTTSTTPINNAQGKSHLNKLPNMHRKGNASVVTENKMEDANRPLHVTENSPMSPNVGQTPQAIFSNSDTHSPVSHNSGTPTLFNDFQSHTSPVGQVVSSSTLHQKIKALRAELLDMKFIYKELVYSLKHFLSDEVLMKILNYFIENFNLKLKRQRTHYENRISGLNATIKEFEDFDAKSKLEVLQAIVNNKEEELKQLQLTIKELESNRELDSKNFQAQLQEKDAQCEKQIESIMEKHTLHLKEKDAEIEELRMSLANQDKILAKQEMERIETQFEEEISKLKEAHNLELQTLIMEKNDECNALKNEIQIFQENEHKWTLQNSMLEQKLDNLMTESRAYQDYHKRAEAEWNSQSTSLQSEISRLKSELRKIEQDNLERERQIFENNKVEMLGEKKYSRVIEQYEKDFNTLHIERNKLQLKNNDLERAKVEANAKIELLEKDIERMQMILQAHGLSQDVEISASKSEKISILNRLIHKLNSELDIALAQNKKLHHTFKRQEREIMKTHDKIVIGLRRNIKQLQKDALQTADNTQIERTMFSTYEERCRTLATSLQAMQEELEEMKKKEKEVVRNAIQRITAKYKGKVELLQKQLETQKIHHISPISNLIS